MLHTHQHYCLQGKVMDRYLAHCLNPRVCDCFVDLRQELAVRESRPEVTRMSAPSSPTPDNDKTDSAVQASLSLPATPLSKNLDNAFTSQTGRRIDFSLRCMQCHTCLHDSLGSCLFAGLANSSTNAALTPSARISALNIVGDLLRKVGVSKSCRLNFWSERKLFRHIIVRFCFFNRRLHKRIWCLIQEFVLFLRL